MLVLMDLVIIFPFMILCFINLPTMYTCIFENIYIFQIIYLIRHLSKNIITSNVMIMYTTRMKLSNELLYHISTAPDTRKAFYKVLDYKNSQLDVAMSN